MVEASAHWSSDGILFQIFFFEVNDQHQWSVISWQEKCLACQKDYNNNDNDKQLLFNLFARRSVHWANALNYMKIIIAVEQLNLKVKIIVIRLWIISNVYYIQFTRVSKSRWTQNERHSIPFTHFMTADTDLELYFFSLSFFFFSRLYFPPRESIVLAETCSL